MVLTVHNKGEPIPQDFLPKVFDPLATCDTPDAAKRRRSGNLGLGLYIVRQIVVSSGGSVEVASSAEEGSTFTVRIPRVCEVASEKQVHAAAAR